MTQCLKLRYFLCLTDKSKASQPPYNDTWSTQTVTISHLVVIKLVKVYWVQLLSQPNCNKVYKMMIWWSLYTQVTSRCYLTTQSNLSTNTPTVVSKAGMAVGACSNLQICVSTPQKNGSAFKHTSINKIYQYHLLSSEPATKTATETASATLEIVPAIVISQELTAPSQDS